MSLSTALRQIRKAKGLSQEAFSYVSSRTYLSSIERNIKIPTINKLEDLCTVMDIHPLTLLTLAYAGEEPQSIDNLLKQVRSELNDISSSNKGGDR